MSIRALRDLLALADCLNARGRTLLGDAVDAQHSTAMIAAADETARIDQRALLERINSKDPSLLVLDVRAPEEYAAGHVPGAINIPYTHLPARISELPSAAEKDIVVYCTVGIRAERAATRFRENGYTRLLHLDGDMKQWLESKQPVEK